VKIIGIFTKTFQQFPISFKIGRK